MVLCNVEGGYRRQMLNGLLATLTSRADESGFSICEYPLQLAASRGRLHEDIAFVVFVAAVAERNLNLEFSHSSSRQWLSIIRVNHDLPSMLIIGWSRV